MLASSNKLKLLFFLLRSISIFVLKFLISILNIFATKSNIFSIQLKTKYYSTLYLKLVGSHLKSNNAVSS